MVQEECQTTWDAILLAFKTIDPIIDCNDTSNVLFPIPHCCTGAGLGLSLAFLEYLHSSIIILQRSAAILQLNEPDFTGERGALITKYGST